MTETYFATLESAPAAYYDGYADAILQYRDAKTGVWCVLAKTHATGKDGQSDAAYVVNRLGSGLHWAEIIGDKDAVTTYLTVR